MPMERAPFGCLTDKPSRYMITPMLKCVSPAPASQQSGVRECAEDGIGSPSLSEPFLLPVIGETNTGISEIYYRY